MVSSKSKILSNFKCVNSCKLQKKTQQPGFSAPEPEIRIVNFQNNVYILKGIFQSKNLGTFTLIQAFAPFLNAPILVRFLRLLGNWFQAQAPLNLKDFLYSVSLVLGGIIWSFLLFLQRLSARYSGSPVVLTL